MQLSKRERNILIVAGLVSVVFAVNSVFPAVSAFYQDRNNAIEDINLEIERERRLFDETITWRDRRTEVELTMEDFEAQVFAGETIPIIEANIQRALTQYARDSQMTVVSTRLADRLETEDWILITQEMSFRTTDAGNTISFLQMLDNSAPRLWVTHFSLDQSRTQYSGSITVAGFARREGVLISSSQIR